MNSPAFGFFRVAGRVAPPVVSLALAALFAAVSFGQSRPVITSVEPIFMRVGDAPQKLVIHGTGFRKGSYVFLSLMGNATKDGSWPVPARYESPTKMVAYFIVRKEFKPALTARVVINKTSFSTPYCFPVVWRQGDFPAVDPCAQDSSGGSGGTSDSGSGGTGGTTGGTGDSGSGSSGGTTGGTGDSGSGSTGGTTGGTGDSGSGSSGGTTGGTGDSGSGGSGGTTGGTGDSGSGGSGGTTGGSGGTTGGTGGTGGSGGVVVPVSPARADAMRFLYRTTWGPTEADIARVLQIGKAQFVQEQLNATPTRYSTPPDVTTPLNQWRAEFLMNGRYGQDQLRQRMAFFLSQIWVISTERLPDAEQIVYFQQMLADHAFGNYFDLMRNATLHPAMARYLDLVDSTAMNQAGDSAPNENYPRELLQLFSLGPVLLNQDGTVRRDGSGNPLPTYSQQTLREFARALSGWTFRTFSGLTPRCSNPANWYQQIDVVCPGNHDYGSKTLLNGYVLPAGLTPQQDLDLALRNIFNHPNLGPFLATRMIRHFVTTNPSPAYVQRVAAAFNNNGSGVRGDLRAMIRATLLDPEADQTGPGVGRIREPVIYALAYLRGLNIRMQDPYIVDVMLDLMSQQLFSPPSVFNYFPLAPDPRSAPASGGVGPELEIYTPSTAIRRTDLMWHLLSNNINGIYFDYSAYAAEKSDAGALVDKIASKLLPQGLTSSERQIIINAVNALSPTDDRRVMFAAYLIGVARFQVQP